MREWLSIKEAGEILGMKRDAVWRLCTKRKLDAKRIKHKGCTWWAIAPESVSALAQERKEEQAKIDAGLRRCGSCGEWKPKKEFPRYGNCKSRESYCKPCRRSANNEWRKRSSAFAEFGRDAVGDSLLDMIGPIKRAEPNDSLRYACMDVGFAHRPIPIGQTKRQAFCKGCEADRCVHHPEMTPEQVRLHVRPKVLYPAKVLASLLDRA